MHACTHAPKHAGAQTRPILDYPGFLSLLPPPCSLHPFSCSRSSILPRVDPAQTLVKSASPAPIYTWESNFGIIIYIIIIILLLSSNFAHGDGSPLRPVCTYKKHVRSSLPNMWKIKIKWAFYTESANLKRRSRSLQVGPMVHTIFVFRSCVESTFSLQAQIIHQVAAGEE